MTILPHAGSWFGLPDFGITEKIGSYLGVPQNPGTGGTGLSNIVARTPNPAPYVPSVSNNVLGANTGQNMSYAPTGFNPTGGSRPYAPTGGGGGGNPGALNISGAQNNAQQNLNDLNSIIERDYATAMQNADLSQSTLQSQAGAATQQAEAGYAPAKTQLGQEQQTALTGIQGQEQTAATNQTNSMQQARDIFRQLQQQNIAQLSGAGLSSSSVAEAMAEKLGVETARRIAGISGTTNEILQNLSKEKANVGTYYQQRMSDLEQQLAATKGSIQSQLVAGINQINQARNQAATDKANRRQELLTNYQNQMFQLQDQAQKFQQSLDQWAQQKSATIQSFQQDMANLTPEQLSQRYAPQYANIASSLQSLPQVAGFNITPQVSFGASGPQLTGAQYVGKPKQSDLQSLLDQYPTAAPPVSG